MNQEMKLQRLHMLMVATSAAMEERFRHFTLSMGEASLSISIFVDTEQDSKDCETWLFPFLKKGMRIRTTYLDGVDIWSVTLENEY